MLLLDTKHPSESRGEFCRHRGEWAACQLQRTRDTKLLAFMHHPPFPIGIDNIDVSRLHDPGELKRILLGRQKATDYLFFGHVHRLVSGVWHGVPFSSFRGTSHQRSTGVAPDGSAVEHGPPFYGLVEVQDEGVLVHTRDIETDAHPGEAEPSWRTPAQVDADQRASEPR